MQTFKKTRGGERRGGGGENRGGWGVGGIGLAIKSAIYLSNSQCLSKVH